MEGCTRNSTSSDNSDMLLNLKMMKVSKPDSYFQEINETECRKQCLAQSECKAYSYEVAQNSTQRTTGIENCRVWASELSNLQEEYTNRACNLSVLVPKSIIGTPFTHWNMLGLIASTHYVGDKLVIEFLLKYINIYS